MKLPQFNTHQIIKAFCVLAISLLTIWAGHITLDRAIFPTASFPHYVNVPALSLPPGTSALGSMTVDAKDGYTVVGANFVLTGAEVGSYGVSFDDDSATLSYVIEAHPVVEMDRNLEGIFFSKEKSSLFTMFSALWLTVSAVLSSAVLYVVLQKTGVGTVPSSLRLNGPQRSRFEQLICEAFSLADFSRFLDYRLNKKLTDFSSGSDTFPQAVGKVIENANNELWWRDLLRELRNARPTDPGLMTFAEEAGQAPTTVDAQKPGAPVVVGRDLELRVRATRSSFDIMTWRTRLGEIESRVCRIEYPEKQARGTGFLIGPDLVMTNYHVIADIRHRISGVEHGGSDPAGVVLRFDFKVLRDGLAVTPGKAYRLADDWLADFSPTSALDVQVDPLGEPAFTELDYAILRVEGEPGKDPVGGDTDDPGSVPRGWIKPVQWDYDFSTNPALYIVQHPDGAPMKVAIDSDAIISVNSTGTRVLYRTETEPGSSGSPCFGPDWEWVAIHQSGDPKYWKANAMPRYNQGIPVVAILKLVRQHGKDYLFA